MNSTLPVTDISSIARTVTYLLFLISTLAVLAGCEKESGIVTYRTEKPEAVQAGNTTERQAEDAPAAEMFQRPAPTAVAQKVRMFAAIVPGAETAWFYKLTGPPAAVEAHVSELADFIASVKYENNQPVWTLPAGWQQQAGNQFRFATLIIPHESTPLELSVSALPGSAQAIPQVVDNINRWRGQVGLGEITAETVQNSPEDVSQETSRRPVEGNTIYFVNLLGQQQETGMRPPFAR